MEGGGVAFVHHQAVLASGLRFAAGAVSGRDRILHLHAGVDFDQSDRTAHMKGLVADPVRRVADTVDDAAADQRGQRNRRIRHHDDEFIAADAADLLAAGQHCCHPLAHLAQHFVAGGVAEQVVDQLETVEVEVGQRQRLPGGHCRHRVFEHLLDAAPVEYLGQRIVVGHEAQLFGRLRFFSGFFEHPLDAPARQGGAHLETLAAFAVLDFQLGVGATVYHVVQLAPHAFGKKLFPSGLAGDDLGLSEHLEQRRVG